MTEKERDLLLSLANHFIAGTPATATGKLKLSVLAQDIRNEAEKLPPAEAPLPGAVGQAVEVLRSSMNATSDTVANLVSRMRQAESAYGDMTEQVRRLIKDMADTITMAGQHDCRVRALEAKRSEAEGAALSGKWWTNAVDSNAGNFPPAPPIPPVVPTPGLGSFAETLNQKTDEIARLNRKILDLEVLASVRLSQVKAAQEEAAGYREARDAANKTIAELRAKVALNKTNTVFHGLASERIKQLEGQVSELFALVEAAYAEGWGAARRNFRSGGDGPNTVAVYWSASDVRQRADEVESAKP